MNKLKLLSLSTIFIFSSSLILISPKKAFALACDSSCPATRSCSFPRCNECKWCEVPATTPQLNNPIIPPPVSGFSGSEFVQKFISVAISVGLIAGALIFFFMFIIGGIRWITSGGDKAAMEGSHSQVTNALIGLAILLSAFAIIQLIGSIFGISLTEIKLPTI